MTDWNRIIVEIRKAGMTDSEIAEAVGVCRHTIWGLCNGRTREPKHALGERLLDMHRRRT